MRKIILIFLIIMVFYPVYVSAQTKDKDIPEINLSTAELEGKAKAGLAIGYPTGLTFGYRLANYLEVNAFLGTHGNDFTLGSSLLFTLADIRISNQILPLSAGPAVFASFDNDFSLMAGGAVRWEYTFEDAPLNLYLEAVPGVILIGDIRFAMASSLGIRYVF